MYQVSVVNLSMNNMQLLLLNTRHSGNFILIQIIQQFSSNFLLNQSICEDVLISWNIHSNIAIGSQDII